MDAAHVGRYLTVLNLMRYAQSAFEEVVHEHAQPMNRWIARLQGEPDTTVVGAMMIEGYRVAMQVLESSHNEADAFARLHAGIQALQDDETGQSDRETRAARSAADFFSSEFGRCRKLVRIQK